MKEELLEIINHYGVNHQQRKLNEEVFELNEAILEYEHFYEHTGKAMTYYNMPTEHITEEIADVCVMLREFMVYYNISQDEIAEMMKNKIDRQLERISKE